MSEDSQTTTDKKADSKNSKQSPANLSNLINQVINPDNLALLKKGDRFIIMAGGLIVLAALGAVTAMKDSPFEQTLLTIVAMVLVIILVGLVQWRAVTMKDAEADLQSQATAARSVNGHWWQLVYSEKHSGLSYVSISISDVAEKHAMHGIAFNENGHRVARWSSDAIAIRTTTPVELFYFWSGTKLDSGQSKVISGLGRFRFDSVGRESFPFEAEGAFTKGTSALLEFESAVTVELIRFRKDEVEQIIRDPANLSKLAIAAFNRFREQRDRVLNQRFISNDGEKG
ncbi:hypothetical protein [Aliikangiella coralliicola]|uniref:DUF3137 domain-containing protein n=1 Tax=Aliikangiella coralliicola TaxID=2592383 RepID=A0A545U8W3_9GAMM|nr:hypothetical protein [Aliikangiella coralliicola]TQV85904.1 hypothetical protein FLL46_18450 [Aliikangiella coralliicola]